MTGHCGGCWTGLGLVEHRGLAVQARFGTGSAPNDGLGAMAMTVAGLSLLVIAVWLLTQAQRREREHRAAWLRENPGLDPFGS